MTTALVTGGAGFIGSHVVDDLVDNLGFDVVVVVTVAAETAVPASLSVSAKKAFLASVLIVQFTGTRWKPPR